MRVTILIMALCFQMFYSDGALADSSQLKHYTARPAQSGQIKKPGILLLINNDHGLYQRAYSGFEDLTGDGSPDLGFNPSAVYIGYFDSGSCYRYENDRFKRSGPATKDGQAPGPGFCGGGQWSGNWLNWFSTSRMDIVRTALYGGKRIVDQSHLTVLEASPTTAALSGVWGTDIWSDQQWSKNARFKPYYDISRYTDLPKPGGIGKANFIVRIGKEIRIAQDVQTIPSTTPDHSGFKVGSWIAAGTSLIEPQDAVTSPAIASFRSLSLRVEVCGAPDGGLNLDAAPNCSQYGNHYKPTGLLQRYGEQGAALFGLKVAATAEAGRSGSADFDRAVTDIQNQINSDGTFIQSSIMKAIDSLEPPASSVKRSPVGKVVYEAVNSFARLKNDDAASASCIQPVVSIISTADQSYSEQPGGYTRADSSFSNSFNITKYLRSITDLEEINKDSRSFLAVKNQGNVSQESAESCEAHAIDSLLDVQGLCPGGLEANTPFGVAAASFLGNVVKGVRSYALDVSSDLPVIKMATPEGHGLTLSPIALATGSPRGGQSSRPDDLSFVSVKNVDILKWQTDSSGQLYSGAFFATFGTARKINGLEFDPKITAGYYIDLLRPCRPEDECSTPATSVEKYNMMLDGRPLDNTEIEAGLEYVYKNWDYSLSPNYAKSSFDTDFKERLYLIYGSERPFAGLKYGEVLDVYGYMGTPGRVYKKIDRPEDIDKAIGVSVFLHSTGGNASGQYPGQIGYNIAGTASDGNYLEILSSVTDLTNFDNRPIAHQYNTPPTCMKAGQLKYFRPMSFSSAMNDASLMPWIKGQQVPYCGSPQLPFTATRLFRFDASSPDRVDDLPSPLWLASKYGGFNDINADGQPDSKQEWDGDGDGKPDTYFQISQIKDFKPGIGLTGESISKAPRFSAPMSIFASGTDGGGVAVRAYYHENYVPPEAPDMAVAWVGGVQGFFIDPWGNLREDSNGNGRLDLASGFTAPRGSPAENGGGDWIVNFRQTHSGLTVDLHRDALGQNGRDEVLAGVAPKGLKTLWDAGRLLAEIPDSDITKPRPYGEDASPGRRIYIPGDAVSGVTLGKTVLSDRNVLRDDPALAYALAPWLGQRDLTGKPDVEAAQTLIRYVMGLDQAGLRSRTTYSPWTDDKKLITWRLGDIINSRPVIVGPAFSHYDFIFRDKSYAAHKKANGDRRLMAYFGANDGMLHAVNLGFSLPYNDKQTGFTADCNDWRPAHQIGKELWSFIPQANLPHLKWLTRPEYSHVYYVDQRPTVVEVKDVSRPPGEQWRTVLIGGLGFGGRAIKIDPDGDQTSYPEVFALDITDPEKEPEYLWRFSHPELGLVASQPMVVRNNADEQDSWYVIIGSGPNIKSENDDYVTRGHQAYKGKSNQQARLFVLDIFSGRPAAAPIESGIPNSFFSGSFVLGAPQYTVKNGGTNQTSWANPLAYLSLTQSVENGPDRGAVMRLEMSQAGTGQIIRPKDWKLNIFYNAKKPVSSPVNAAYDSKGQLWVLFGTGRYWSEEDARPCDRISGSQKIQCLAQTTNYLYGLKEPFAATGFPLLSVIGEEAIADVSTVSVYPDGGLQVVKADGSSAPSFAAEGEMKPIDSYAALSAYLASDQIAGYKKALVAARSTQSGEEVQAPEMVLNQPVLHPLPGGQSNAAFVTYQPAASACSDDERSRMYLVDAFTGLPRPEQHLYDSNIIFQRDSGSNLSLQGAASVADYLRGTEGRAFGPITIRTGPPGSRRVIYRADNINGSSQEIIERSPQAINDKIISWREITDFSNRLNADGARQAD